MTHPTRIRLGIFLASVALGAAYWSLKMSSFPSPRQLTSSLSRGGTSSGSAAISGTVRMPDGAVRPTTVDLFRPSDVQPSRGSSVATSRRFTTNTDSQGQFSFPRVPSAEYVVVARADDPSSPDGPTRHFWAAATVTGTNRPPPLALTLREGASVRGRISATALAGSAPPDLSHGSLMLLPADAAARATIIIGYPHAIPGRDGSFAFEDVAPGQYTLQYGVDAPWSIDAAAVEGQDWLETPITLAPGAHPIGAVIALTDRPGGVAGEVRLPDGQPAGFRLVFVFDVGPMGRLSLRRARATRSDARGHFAVAGLPSGEYFAAVASEEDPLVWYSTPFFERLATGAARVMVAPGPARDVRLLVR